MVERIVYRRHNSFNTKSNKLKYLRTPGGRLAVHVKKKKAKVPSCGDCKRVLRGISAVRPFVYRRLKQREKHVTRAYGGSRCHLCVRSRITRAFLIQEQECVKQVLAEKMAAAKAADKPAKKSKKSKN